MQLSSGQQKLIVAFGGTGSDIKSHCEKTFHFRGNGTQHLQNIRKVIQMHNAAAMLNALHREQVMQNSPLRLTPRGVEASTLIFTGMSIKQAAVELGISFSCARRHKEKMLLCNRCNTINELSAKHCGHTKGNSAEILKP